MAARFAWLVACVVMCGATLPAQVQIQPPPPASPGVERFLARLQAAVETSNRADFIALIDDPVDRFEAARFADDVIQPGVVRAVVRERDRLAAEGRPQGTAFRLVLEFYTETQGRARIVTALIEVGQGADGGVEGWRLTSIEGLTSVEGLYKLRLNMTTQFAARELTVRAEDLLLTLHEGNAFVVESEDGITGLILSGRGTMQFAPTPVTEKGQLRIFSGTDVLSTPFDSTFVRLHPADFETRVSTAQMTPVPVDVRDLRRAEETFAREALKSYTIDLSDISPDSWWLLPQRGDFLAEVRTRRFRTLTYSRTAAQIEDITLFDRERRKTLSLYPSAERFASLGRAYNAADLRDYDVLEYAIEARVDPERETIDARARVRVRVLAGALSTLTLRLSDDLNVRAVASVEHGTRLLHLRVAGQNSVIVNLPEPMIRDQEISLIVVYSGPVPSQRVDTEALAVALAQTDFPAAMLQHNFVLSNRAFWYPQNPIGDYATATMRITVPDNYVALASGVQQQNLDVRLTDLITQPAGTRAFSFEATQPLRYLALVVSRFSRVAESSVTTATGDRVSIGVETQSRQQGRGRELLPVVEDMVRFYSDLVSDAPYEATTLALLESELPGGHSPGYVAMVNTPLPGLPYTWGNDPAAFEGFPDFFIAHEVAHQWWGQAVGWRNYHEQWISEGFAQYFTALYARRTRGEETFNGMLRQFRRWAIAESDEGPISLGYRLGHVKEDPRIFRALVYNKAAGVLHMLRRLIGDEAFFAGLQRFYDEQKFQRTGTEDVRRAFEAASGRQLERFFEDWIYGIGIPRIRVTRVIGTNGVTMGFEQLGDQVMQVPVTVTLVYADGRSEDVVVPVTERKVDQRIPASGPVRRIEINRDNAAIADFQLAF